VFRIVTAAGDGRKRLRAVQDLGNALADYKRNHSAGRTHMVEYFVPTPAVDLEEPELLVREFSPDE
jgi:hypothetical protein